MKLGFVSAILPDLSFEEIVQFASETGYDCIEIMCWPKGKAERRYAGVTHIDVTNFKPADAQRIKAILKGAGVSISSLGYYPNYLTPNAQEAKAVTAHFQKVIKASAMLGIGRATTFIGRDWTKSVDDNWPKFRKVWKPLIKLAEASKVRIGIENCPMLFTNDEWPGGKNLAATPAIWRRMFEEIPSKNFGLNFDPSHLVWQHLDCAKAVLNFGEDVEVFNVTGALVDGEIYDESGVEALSKLPTLGEIQAQLVGLIIAPAAGLVNVLNSGTTQVLNVVAAYAAKEEEAA